MQISLDKIGLQKLNELTQAVQRLADAIEGLMPIPAPPTPPVVGDFAKETTHAE